MSFEEIDTEDSASSLSEVSSLDDEFDTMHLDFDSSEEVTDYDDDDDMDLHTWNEIEPESDAEFLEDHGLIEDVTSISEDNTINPIDCYRHFITDEIIDLIVRETKRYAQQYLQTHDISRRSIFKQWKPINNTEMLKFFGIVIEMGLVQMPKLKHKDLVPLCPSIDGGQAQFHNTLMDMGYTMKDKEFDKLWDKFDTDGFHAIGLEKFIRRLTNEESFNENSSNIRNKLNNGLISKNDMKLFIEDLLEFSLSPDEYYHLYKQFPCDQYGRTMV
ncbi:unnamed protein product [Rotaria sp. Silwood1]|nr:unnamed protein product [Rotaria sp. Silwood1]CAF1619429.1 unnamed protein product [Rotaria sp. Silwood1]